MIAREPGSEGEEVAREWRGNESASSEFGKKVEARRAA
jgi:hypothetical protein